MRGKLALAVVILPLAACVHARTAPARPEAVIHGDPIQVTAGDNIDLLLASMNDEELFAKGTSSYAAGDYGVAAKAFDRLFDLFPRSSHFAAASYNAGLAHEQLAAKAQGEDASVQWQAALERYKPLLDLEKGTGDQIDAGFRAAECLYHLEKFDDAIALLRRIQARTDLPLGQRIEAETQVGICQIEAGDLSAGESTLRDVMRQYDDSGNAERLDDYYPAQAQFYLGEIYRTYFDQVTLDPNKQAENPKELCPEVKAASKPKPHKGKKAEPAPPAAPPCDPGLEQLAKDLEYKAEMLLSAQGHYLRAIRVGNAQWATAAGQRIGALYETMYDAMTQAPVPHDLDAEQVELYRLELRKKVRVLVTKAITIYEQTLEAAERTATEGPFIQQARASLERMKAVMLSDAKAESASQETPAADPMPDAPKPSTSLAPVAVPPVASR